MVIAVDEPALEDLKIIPWRGFFWWQGTKVEFGASKTIGRARLPDVYHRALDGEFGRYWVADPCTAILFESLNRKQMLEDEAEKAWKAKRREERAKLVEEDRAQKRQRARRRAW